MKRKTKGTAYPRIGKLGIPVKSLEDHPDIQYVSSDALRGILEKHRIGEEFNKLFGIQTMTEFGPYPWDVEAVLEVMATGKKTGSQLLWD